MRVGLFSPNYPGVTGDGGIGTYTRTLAEELLRMGHSTHVVSLGRTDERISAGGVVIETVAPRYIPIVDRLLPAASSLWRVGERSLAVSRTWHLEIFEFPNWEGLGLWFALRRQAPLVVRLHTSAAETQEIEQLRKTWGLFVDVQREKLQTRLADALVTHSRAHQQRMATEIGIAPETIKVIPHGIRTYPGFIRTNVPKTEATVVFLGRLERRKGALDLLRAIPLVLSTVPNTQFVLIGRDRAHCPGGRTHQQYVEEEFPGEVRQKIRFAGALEDADVTTHLQKADIFVAPSLYESFGLVFLEAMRWGTPVVGTNVGGIPEIVINGESGVLVSPGNHAELAAAMTSLLLDEGKRRHLGAAGRQRVEEIFSAERMAARTFEFYSAVKAGWKSPSAESRTQS